MNATKTGLTNGGLWTKGKCRVSRDGRASRGQSPNILNSKQVELVGEKSVKVLVVYGW